MHRIRNEGTEKDLPAGKFCTGDLVKSNEHATVLDADVTCPKCLEFINILFELKSSSGRTCRERQSGKPMRTKPKSASEKRNHIKIFYVVKQPILKKLHENQFNGSALSLLDDVQINNFANAVTNVVMQNENINVCLKRRK